MLLRVVGFSPFLSSFPDPCVRHGAQGFGFVHFRDAETCAAAIKQGKGGHWKLHGRPLLVRSLNPPKAAAEIGDEGSAKDHALVEGRRAGGVLAQREKELPGMIVQVTTFPHALPF